VTRYTGHGPVVTAHHTDAPKRCGARDRNNLNNDNNNNGFRVVLAHRMHTPLPMHPAAHVPAGGRRGRPRCLPIRERARHGPGWRGDRAPPTQERAAPPGR